MNLAARPSSRGARLAVFAATAVVLTPAPGPALQPACGAARADSAAVPAQAWSPPFDRRVSLRGRDISLREALDRLAAAARVRLSYTAELLPLDQRVCIAYESLPLGEALADLLRGVPVEPVAAGADQVVLSPVLPAERETTTPIGRSVGVLDRVVVTGSATGGPQRPIPVALDVIDGGEIARRGASTVSSVLDGHVPGVWIWEQSPSSLVARYASIRGASSFGVSHPKVYIDGIEVANSLLITHLDPSSIARVEVIRGPQGAALYGADAISGVISIVTRQDGVGDGSPRTRLRSTAGMTGSRFAGAGVLAQHHSLSMRTGSGVRSAGLSLAVSTLGEFVPGAFARQIATTGTVRLVGAKSIITGTARFFAADAGAVVSPIIAGTIPAGGGSSAPSYGHDGPLPDQAQRQRVRQYTLGTTALFKPDARWTHSFVLGIDGYRLADASALGIPFPSATDSALRAARGSAGRGTVRVSSVAQLGSLERLSGTVTIAAEHSAVRERSESSYVFARAPGSGALRPTPSAIVDWRSNTGLITQVGAAWRDALFVTGGVRLDRNDGVIGVGQVTTLPMIGAAWVRDVGPAELKLRTAYGKGIRPARSLSRAGSWMRHHSAPAPIDLQPEQQTGVEGGAELLFGRALSLGVTRFDQRASGLIQPVAIAEVVHPGDPTRLRIAYQLQNVGEIENAGWEMQGRASAGPLSVAGTLSLVESRVARVAVGYSGELRPGDRMLEVPARTASLTASWTGGRWHTSWTAARASDWVNYDRVALAEALADPAPMPNDLVGDRLRRFWRTYDGVTRVRATFSYDLRSGLGVTFTGDNLLGRQLGEPDNITVLPGRTLTAGVHARF